MPRLSAKQTLANLYAQHAAVSSSLAAVGSAIRMCYSIAVDTKPASETDGGPGRLVAFSRSEHASINDTAPSMTPRAVAENAAL